MSPSPAHLRASAEALRTLAATLTVDIDGLDAHAGPATWEGPAATAHRGRAAVIAFDARVVALDLRGVADELDARAVEVEDHRAARAHQAARVAALAGDPATRGGGHG